MRLSALYLALHSSALTLAASLLETRQTTPLTQYIVENQCPSAINLFIAGQLDSSIPSQGNTTKFLPANAGFFYTDANGGNSNGLRTLRAGFYGEQFYYYMVKDPDYVNVGMNVAPQGVPSRQGYCVSVGCSDVNCPTAFSSPPTRFPPSGSTAPNPPFYQCPIANTTYRITFCPGGQWPGPETWRIHPGFNTAKCLDVRGAVFSNGTPVQIYDCNGTAAQNWILNRGATSIRLNGTNFCLDAGSNPANGVGMKIWQCYDNLPAQQWFYRDDNRITLQNQGRSSIILICGVAP
ncbi:G-X-X-X-Q-X-W domain-containing protein [Coprinopsis cinerea okayama7|uniref:G-X-X-X-Q-X-W domain-containing protein n=1 Tax=Coprinopsis cinerea (strain Okayama-7 / 130 / ATCC MYA-4618 / FGSC 9003) TaxID=240176 RepID=A8P8P5_COPC7|nr:G-X-X-X-Q-X-W domain-containing protein [Coprinopsis cinerea okayama7\|eukprot:XP_001839610.2 G-X-X-X-Q-X-W domain-containing protein [Coprinopsis cinerea okayama7\